MTKKPKGEFRVEVCQVGDEDVPGRWRRFWGGPFVGNPWAWAAYVYHLSFLDGKQWLSYRHGYTRDQAVEGALADARDRLARYRLAEDSREEFYV